MTNDKAALARWLTSVLISLPVAGVTASQSGLTEGGDAPSRTMNNPGSIIERLETEAAKKDYLFQFPGIGEAMKSWHGMKADLDERYGFKFGISYTALYQKASDTFGPEDDAAGFDLDISGAWAFLGRETGSPTTLGYQFFWRDDLGTELTPQTLFTQYGSLYSGAGPYGETDPVVGQLWLQKRFGNVFGFQVGKVFPITGYDFFPFKNFRTDFIDFNHATNAAIPLPDYGLGGFARYRPVPNVRLGLGLHDANADVEESGFDTYDGELFKIVEIGYDTGLAPRVPGRPPSGYVQLSFWHQDERDDVDIDDGWGVGISAVQRFGRLTPFARLGYADVTTNGPTPVKYMANIGLAVDKVFGQLSDRVAVGYTWSDPANRSLDHQHTIDAYYRMQMTPEIQLGPMLHIVFDPVLNPDDDTIVVWGMRARIAL